MKRMLTGVAGLIVVTASQAITFDSEDLILRDKRGITLLDTVTGAVEPFVPIDSGFKDIILTSLLSEADGNILMHNSGSPVIRLNPVTSVQTTVLPGGGSVPVKGIAEDASGRVFGFDATSVMEFDLQTTQPRIIASGAAFSDITTIVVDSSGDIIVGDAGKKAILRVDSTSGQVSQISANGFIVKPAQIVIDQSEDLVVVDRSAFTTGYFYKIDPVTGTQTQPLPLQLSTPGGLSFTLSEPNSLAIDGNGNFVVTDNQGIFHIDLQTEVATEYAADVIRNATRVAIDPDGNYLFTGFESESHAIDTNLRVDGLYRVNPLTGITELLQGLPYLVSARLGPIAVDKDGKFVVTDKVTVSDIPAIIALDRRTGGPELIASGGMLQDPVALAVDADGDILVADNGNSSVIRIDRLTGSQTLIASGGNITGIVDMVANSPDSVIVLTATPATAKSLVEVTLSSGNQRVIVSDLFLTFTTGFDVDAAGNIVAQTWGPVSRNLEVLGIDAVSGQTTLLSSSSGSSADIGSDIVDSRNGSLFLAEALDGIVRVDKTTGVRTSISSSLQGLLPARMVMAPDLVGNKHRNELVIDFGAIGLWAWVNDTGWLKLNNASPDKVVLGDVDGDGRDDVIADFSSTFGGIFIKRNLGGWLKLHNFAPESMAVGDLDNNGKEDIVIDFGGIGLWARMNDTNWLKLNNSSPDKVLVADMDGNGADDVVADFSTAFGGIFVKQNLGGWAKLHNFSTEAWAAGDLDANGKDDVVIDFGGIGLWARMNDASWLKLHNSSPDLVTTGDLDGNGADDVIATFSGSGLWRKLNLGGWGQLNPNAPDEVVTGDVDGNGQDDVIGKFGSTIGGIFVKRNQGGWSKLHNFSPDSLATGNLDGN